MNKQKDLRPYQVKLSLPSTKKRPALLKGSCISHKTLDFIEKRTTYYSSLCPKLNITQSKLKINLKNLQPDLPEIKLKNKGYRDKKFWIRVHRRANSDLQILAKNNLIETDLVPF